MILMYVLTGHFQDICCYSERDERHRMVLTSKMRRYDHALKRHYGSCFRNRLEGGNRRSSEAIYKAIVIVHVRNDYGLDHL